jgi:hypothetical protein
LSGSRNPRAIAHSNAQTIVLLEQLRDDVHEVYELIAKLDRAKELDRRPSSLRARAILPG